MIRGYHVGSDTMTPYELALVDLMENLEAHYTEALARIESLERDLSIEREIAGEVALEALARITDLEKERDQYKVEFDATTDAVTVHIIQQRDAALSRIKVLEQELDAAQTLAADYCANTEDALSQRDDAREEADRQCNKKVAALRTAGDNAEAGHKLMIALDAALARIKVLEGEASLLRVAQGCGKKGPP